MTTDRRYGESENTPIGIDRLERTSQHPRSMIPFDAKNYRAPSQFSTSGYSVIGIVLLVILLAWMGERDREAHVKRVQEVASSQCR